jgi:ketosteroid isomerase-like protein
MAASDTTRVADISRLPDAVRRFCAAAAADDLDGVIATLAADAELVSPLSGRLVFRGREDLRILLGAVYSTLDGLRWEDPIAQGQAASAVAVATAGGLRVDDALLFELNPQGEIAHLRPHLRPWLATTLFALLLGPKVARHPAVLWRAVRAGARRRT